MNGLARLTLTAIALGGMAAAAPASADMAPGHPGHQPCHFYLHRNLPAPKRCFRYFQDALGPDVYVHGAFVFRNREAFLRFREHGPARGEDRWANRNEDRYEDRAEDRDRDSDHDRYAEREDMGSRKAPPPEEDGESTSGGASRGNGHMYEGQSGGASRGSHVPENRSGGASGY